MSKKIVLFNRKPNEGVQKCAVYLKLPWIGTISLNFEKQTKIAIKGCYQAVEPRIVFTTRKILPAIHKDVLPSFQQNMVVYQYVCRCDCRYVGRTSQRLQDRINQHIPRCIRSDKRPTKNLPNQECKITSTPCCLLWFCNRTAFTREWRMRQTFQRCTIFHFGYSKTFVPFISSGSNLHLFLTAYSLPSKEIRLFTPNFTLIFFFHFSDETETIFFHQSNCQNDQFWPIRERQEIFYIFYTFALTFMQF